MTVTYLILMWGFILPVLALICLAADVATGTALWHSPERTNKKGNKK